MLFLDMFNGRQMTRTPSQELDSVEVARSSRGLLQPPVRIGPLLFSVLLGLVVFFSFPSFLSCRRTGSTSFLSLFLLLLLLFCLFFGFGPPSFTSSSLSKPGLLFAMNVSKERRTCFLVNSNPHL